jgi:hypothetical protein
MSKHEHDLGTSASKPEPKLWNTALDAKYISFIISVLALIIGSGANLTTKPLSQISSADLLHALAVGSTFSIFLFLITEKLTSVAELDRTRSRIRDAFLETKSAVEKRSSELERLVAGDNHVICLGHPNEAIARIASSIPQASLAYNTLVSYGRVDASTYDEDGNATIVRSLQQFLRDKSAKWIDIVSDPDDEVVRRMQLVFADTTVSKNGYFCYKLKQAMPFINFLVLDFGGARAKEVYFGFGRHSYDEVGDVFYSTGINLVAFFERWHSTLRTEELSTLSSVQRGKSTRELMEGIWRSVAYSGKEVKNIAYVHVTPRLRGATIKGFLFDKRGEILGWFDADDVLISGSKLIFLYYRVTSQEVTTDTKAIAIYDFGDERMFVGKLFEVGEGNMVALNGRRASQEEEDMVMARDWDRAPAVIAKFLNQVADSHENQRSI